jgi:hypothetical protein
MISNLTDVYVASLLGDWERILECEDEISRMESVTPALDHAVNRSLYELYQKCATEAEQVLTRIRHLIAQGYRVNDIEALEDAYARVQARLKLTPDMVEHAMQQIRQGEGIPMKELRDELCARVRA